MLGPSRSTLDCCLQPDYFVPDPELFSALGAVFLCFQTMPPRTTMFPDWPEGGEKTLGMAGGLEVLQNPLTLTDGLVRVFGAVVQIAALAMLDAR